MLGQFDRTFLLDKNQIFTETDVMGGEISYI